MLAPPTTAGGNYTIKYILGTEGNYSIIFKYYLTKFELIKKKKKKKANNKNAAHANTTYLTTKVNKVFQITVNGIDDKSGTLKCVSLAQNASVSTNLATSGGAGRSSLYFESAHGRVMMMAMSWLVGGGLCATIMSLF